MTEGRASKRCVALPDAQRSFRCAIRAQVLAKSASTPSGAWTKLKEVAHGSFADVFLVRHTVKGGRE